MVKVRGTAQANGLWKQLPGWETAAICVTKILFPGCTMRETYSAESSACVCHVRWWNTHLHTCERALGDTGIWGNLNTTVPQYLPGLSWETSAHQRPTKCVCVREVVGKSKVCLCVWSRYVLGTSVPGTAELLGPWGLLCPGNSNWGDQDPGAATEQPKGVIPAAGGMDVCVYVFVPDRPPSWAARVESLKGAFSVYP